MSEEQENEMVKRFHRHRWCDTRIAIHDMKVGQELIFPNSEYSNARHSVERLNDAYWEEREWKLYGSRKDIKVTRLK